MSLEQRGLQVPLVSPAGVSSCPRPCTPAAIPGCTSGGARPGPPSSLCHLLAGLRGRICLRGLFRLASADSSRSSAKLLCSWWSMVCVAVRRSSSRPRACPGLGLASRPSSLSSWCVVSSSCWMSSSSPEPSLCRWMALTGSSCRVMSRAPARAWYFSLKFWITASQGLSIAIWGHKQSVTQVGPVRPKQFQASSQAS